MQSVHVAYHRVSRKRFAEGLWLFNGLPGVQGALTIDSRPGLKRTLCRSASRGSWRWWRYAPLS